VRESRPVHVEKEKRKRLNNNKIEGVDGRVLIDETLNDCLGLGKRNGAYARRNSAPNEEGVICAGSQGKSASRRIKGVIKPALRPQSASKRLREEKDGQGPLLKKENGVPRCVSRQGGTQELDSAA